RPTVIAFFGDHLPPLGDAYVESGYMKQPVADRKAPLADMKRQHETPLLVWSNRGGSVKAIGSISPAFIPLYVFNAAGITHPYYTGMLGEVRSHFDVIDRHMLLPAGGVPEFDWQREGIQNQMVSDLRLLQYDIMFGEDAAGGVFFPEVYGQDDLLSRAPEWSRYAAGRWPQVPALPDTSLRSWVPARL
ncbi:MAG: hypothetical protein JNL61_01145, partial [Rhizobiaceae bacterium]|nr:hypothetical protein [Rhizobiaceae bacterium]